MNSSYRMNHMIGRFFCVEHLMKAQLEFSANQSGTLNECERKRSISLVRRTLKQAVKDFLIKKYIY